MYSEYRFVRLADEWDYPQGVQTTMKPTAWADVMSAQAVFFLENCVSKKRSARAQDVWRTSVFCRPEWSGECRDSDKKGDKIWNYCH